MKKIFLTLFLFLTYYSQTEDCLPIEATRDFRCDQLRLDILNNGRNFNEISIKKNTGEGGSLSSTQFMSAVSSIELWYGGFDPAGNLKIAAGINEFRRFDWYAGPLDENGLTDTPICDYWDQVFYVTKDDILKAYALNANGHINCEDLPDAVKYWPAKNNPYLTADAFYKNQEFAYFWDNDSNGNYDPCMGDLPAILLDDCHPNDIEQLLQSTPQQIAFWITNDAGGPHILSNGLAINVEVHNYAFNFSNEDLDNTIFFIYNIINKSSTDLFDSHIGVWFDFDLGWPVTNFIGVSDDKETLYAYNDVSEDLIDGPFGDMLESKPPLMGYSILQGNYEEVGPPGSMSNQYLRHKATSAYIPPYCSSITPSNQCPPSMASEYYYNLIGRHRDSSTQIDYNGAETKFTYVGNPAQTNGGSFCVYDSLYINTTAVYSSGPGDTRANESTQMVSAFFMTKDVQYPCPDISSLTYQQELIQIHYDNCFQSLIGPTAPNLILNFDNQKLQISISNDFVGSNNIDNAYEEKILENTNMIDSTYKFEGYKIYQVASKDFDLTELNNLEVSKLIYQGDLQNNVSAIDNWKVTFEGGSDKIYYQENKVNGSNQGLTSTFTLNTDAFTGDKFESDKEYHFVAIAYAYNNFEDFDTLLETGQKKPYLESSCNVKVTTIKKSTTSNKNIDLSKYFDISLKLNQFELTSKENLQLNLFSINGTIVYDWEIDSLSLFKSGDLSSQLPAGMYILNIRSKKSELNKSFRLIIVNQ